MKTQHVSSSYLKWLMIMMLVISTSAATAHPVQIVQLRAKNHCQGADLNIENIQGEYILSAYFPSLTAQAMEEIASDGKRCRLQYQVVIDPAYQLEAFDFVIDGSYQLSRNSSVRLAVAHRIDHHNVVRGLANYETIQGDAPFGEIYTPIGSIHRQDLPEKYTLCGATIPLRSRIYTQTVKQEGDLSGVALITLDGKATHQGRRQLGKIRLRECP
ncbi:MAG: hypothetical protein OXT67_13005 [Zetaproteobacteria bacterium]|nr:hypothetical protein [Zetaproteobacteria bacterium]